MHGDVFPVEIVKCRVQLPTLETLGRMGAVISGISVISGIVWVDKRCYDWSVVFKVSINQSQLTFVRPNDSRNRCAESS